MWVIWDLITLYPEINKHLLLKVSYWCHLSGITLLRFVVQSWTYQIWLEENSNLSKLAWHFVVVYLAFTLTFTPPPPLLLAFTWLPLLICKSQLNTFFFLNLQEEMQIAKMQMLVVTRSYIQKYDIGLCYRTNCVWGNDKWYLYTLNAVFISPQLSMWTLSLRSKHFGFFSSLGKLLSKQQKLKRIQSFILLTCTYTFTSLWWKKGVIFSNYSGLNSHITIYCYNFWCRQALILHMASICTNSWLLKMDESHIVF